MEENRKTELMNLAGRLERLRRLMGQDMPQPVQQSAPAVEEEGEKQEKMLMAAIPFLDQEYQRDLYVVVRLMEMRRMLTGGVLRPAAGILCRHLCAEGRCFQPFAPACPKANRQDWIPSCVLWTQGRSSYKRRDWMDWTKAQMEALGEERLRLIREAQEKSKDKTGLERLDVFLEYGEALAQGGSLSKEEQKALLAAVSQNLPEGDRAQMQQIMGLMGL